jgi:hypothetical protein
MTLVDDVRIICQAMKPYLEAGKEILVVCHSFGGIAGTDSIVGNTVDERRARGARGGVMAIVYIASFAPSSAGLSLFNLTGLKGESEHPHWWFPVVSSLENLLDCLRSRHEHHWYWAQGGFAMVDEKAGDIMHEGVDKEMARMCMDITVPQSLRSFQDPCSHGTAEVQAPKTYITTQQDGIVPYEGQMAMASAASARVISLTCGHSPFLLKRETNQLLETLLEVARQSVH